MVFDFGESERGIDLAAEVAHVDLDDVVGAVVHDAPGIGCVAIIRFDAEGGAVANVTRDGPAVHIDTEKPWWVESGPRADRLLTGGYPASVISRR